MTPVPARLPLILVEGYDDAHVVRNLLRYAGLTAEVKPKGGFPALIRSLHVELRATSPDRLAIVVDADSPISSRWQSLRDILRNSGRPSIPDVLPREGLIHTASEMMTVGVWIMPDNNAEGNLEDFTALLVPGGDTLWPLARNAVDGIPHSQRRFRPQRAPKARILTWLAWQEEPGTPLGAAINQKYLDPSSPHAAPFLEWLRRFLASA